jgi:phosphinothricin acetyltransferase
MHVSHGGSVPPRDGRGTGGLPSLPDTRNEPEARVDDISIRPAALADAAAMAAIYNQAVVGSTATFDTEPEAVEQREAWLRDHTAPQHPVLVAERDGRVVGWASLSRYSDRCAYIATVEASTYIDENETGRGLGTALSEAVMEAGRRGGVHAVISRICTENTASLAMVRKLGFEEIGVMREVGRKFDRLLDVMFLERILPPA